MNFSFKLLLLFNVNEKNATHMMLRKIVSNENEAKKSLNSIKMKAIKENE